ncbi:hypothetical protein WMW72_16605 [Paenibacillus filicis]|uniref:Uncharacterized protein n=1 Tax=Paenibacillus filicis TaxID=669464 RepID=A0ABU9DN80_9BACL
MVRKPAWLLHILAVMTLLALFLPDSQVLAAPVALLTVKSSSGAAYESRLAVDASRLVKSIHAARARRTEQNLKGSETGNAPVFDTYLKLSSSGAGSEEIYLLNRRGDLYEEATHQLLPLDAKTGAYLKEQAGRLRTMHYGAIHPWPHASTLLPKMTKFTITDLETGLSFQAQHRAGRQHADVQPLTKADTAVMKQIYNGVWSWERRAVLVQAGDGQRLAASMAGMPHGGDGIPGNDFSGHFCLHFLGSTTHGSAQVDLEHQLMVRKAGGALDDYFGRAGAEEVAAAYVAAIHLRDSQLLKLSFGSLRHPQLEETMRWMHGLAAIRPSKNQPVQSGSINGNGLLALDFPIQVELTRKERKPEHTTLMFRLRRLSPIDSWHIESVDKRS